MLQTYQYVAQTASHRPSRIFCRHRGRIGGGRCCRKLGGRGGSAYPAQRLQGGNFQLSIVPNNYLILQAPTPGQEWTSPTPSEWERSIGDDNLSKNVSILPMDLLSEELLNKTNWETSSMESLAKSCLDFTFTTGLEHVDTVTPQMTNPCDIAYVKNR